MVIEATAHGVLVLFELLEADDRVMERLHPNDAARARAFPVARRQSFVAGRLALQQALEALGAPSVSLGSDDRGAPVIPGGFVGSVSHKANRAAALAAKDDGARVGVDVEEVRPLRAGLDERILTAGELARISSLDTGARDLAVLASFAAKEAVYKAIDPFVRRYVGFHEATLVLPSIGARADVRVSLALASPTRLATPVQVEATIERRGMLLLATARARC